MHRLITRTLRQQKPPLPPVTTSSASTVDQQLGKLRTAVKFLVDKVTAVSDAQKAQETRLESIDAAARAMEMMRKQIDEVQTELARLQGGLATLRDAVAAQRVAETAPGGGGGLTDANASSQATAVVQQGDTPHLLPLERRVSSLEEWVKRYESSDKPSVAAAFSSTALKKIGLVAEVDADGATLLSTSRVEVRDLPPTLRSVSSLKNHMESAGPVRSCLLRRELSEHSADGVVALVTYVNVHDAVRAVENLNRSHFSGAILRVSPCGDIGGTPAGD